MVVGMRALLRRCRSPRGRLAANLGCAGLAIAVAVLAGRHFAAIGWPLAHANSRLVAVTGALFLVAYAFKAYGWQRLFAPHERPQPLALAAAGGAASVTGIALPGRFDDVVRVAVVRRYPGCPARVGPVCFSLITLGLIDAAALTPLASVAAGVAEVSPGLRAGLAVVAGAGVAAALLVVALPRLAGSARLLRFRVARWLAQHSTSPREASKAWGLVLASWLVRCVALFLLLGAFGVFSIPLAMLFLCASAASAALPIAPAGQATQAGAGAAILIASGVGASKAIAFAVAAQTLIILAGAAVVLLAAVWQAGLRLAPSRA